MNSKRINKTLLISLLMSLFFAWTAAASGQQDTGIVVKADDLPEGLRQLDIEDSYIPSGFREIGVIHALNGTVVVVHRADGRAFFGRPGDRIHENDELHTLKDSRCRVLLLSDDVVSIAPETSLAVDSFQDLRGEGEKTSLFSMARGKAMFYAMRLFRYRETRFQVKTPTAIVGVRGTKFGIDVFQVDPGRTASLTPVRVADSAGGFDALIAQAGGQGQGDGTIIACGDGTLDVYDPETNQFLAEVNPNEEFNTLTGQKRFDPANRTLNQIQQASHVLDDDEDDGLPEPDDPFEGEDDPDLVEDSGFEDSADFADTLANVAQTETGSGTEGREPTPDAITPFRGTEANPLMGYFSALLFNSSTGSLRNAFVNSLPQQLDPLDEAFAYGVIDPGYVMVDEGPGGTDVGEVFLDGEGSSDPFSIEGIETFLGQYDYLQWGYVQASVTPTPEIAGTIYELVNKFWFVEGYPTTDFAGLSGFYNYSGVVHGTYYAPGVTADLKGSYTSQVHFGSSYIQNFLMNASGGGHSISFTQSGQSTVDSNGRFIIELPGEGTFRINGNAVDYWRVTGAHFGGGAKEQGGAFAAGCPATNEGAYGIFAGKR